MRLLPVATLTWWSLAALIRLNSVWTGYAEDKEEHDVAIKGGHECVDGGRSVLGIVAEPLVRQISGVAPGNSEELAKPCVSGGTTIR